MDENARSPPSGEDWSRDISLSKDHHAFHEPGGSAKVSTTVVHALADAMGVDVTDIGFSLYDSIDPDALDRIFAQTTTGPPRAPGHVAFSVDGYRVTVYSSGHIVITPP